MSRAEMIRFARIGSRNSAGQPEGAREASGLSSLHTPHFGASPSAGVVQAIARIKIPISKDSN